MPDTITITGAALAYVERPFQSFTDRMTGELVEAGTTRTLWVGTDFDVEPVLVKVPGALADSLAKVTRGSSVVAVVALQASGNKIVHRLQSVEVKNPARGPQATPVPAAA